MSSSSLWLVGNTGYGREEHEYQNSWLFAPNVWDVMYDKHVGKKFSLLESSESFEYVGERIEESNIFADRVVWALARQIGFYTKDKGMVADSLREFAVEYADELDWDTLLDFVDRVLTTSDLPKRSARYEYSQTCGSWYYNMVAYLNPVTKQFVKVVEDEQYQNI